MICDVQLYPIEAFLSALHSFHITPFGLDQFKVLQPLVSPQRYVFCAAYIKQEMVSIIFSFFQQGPRVG